MSCRSSRSCGSTAAVIPEHQRLAAFSTVDGGVFRILEFGAPEWLFEHKAAVTRLHVRQSELYAAGLDGIASVYDLQQEAVVASIAHWGPVQGVEAVGPRLIASLTENGFLQGHLVIRAGTCGIRDQQPT